MNEEKKVIIATGYHDLDEALKEKIPNSQIVNYQEFILKEQKLDILITSKHLPGGIAEKEFFFMLKKKNCRVIYATNKNDKNSILNCFEFSFYDFIFDPITAEKIIDVLNNPRSFDDVSPIYLQYTGAEKDDTPINIKNEEKEVIEKVKIVKQKVIETRFVKQNVITFFCSDNNILNNTILSNAAVAFQKKNNNKILAIDFNTLPCLDHAFNVNKEILVKDNFNLNKIDTGISACYSAIENNTFCPELFSKFTIKSKKCNVDVLTGIYDDGIIKKLETDHYNRILEAAKDIYDVILISVNPFKYNTATVTSIANSSKVIVTCESNYTAARNTVSALKSFSLAGMLKDKFGIVAVNSSTEHLDLGVMEKIFEEYRVISEIPFNKSYAKCLNDRSIFIDTIHANKHDKEAFNKIVSFMGLSQSKVIINESEENEEENENAEDTPKKAFFKIPLFKIPSFKSKKKGE